MNNIILILIVIIMLYLHFSYISLIIKNRVESLYIFNDKINSISKNIRKELAMDYHDDIGTQISAVITLSNALGVSGYNLSKEQQGLISKIKSTSDTIVSSSRDSVWLADPTNQEPLGFINYLQELGTQIFLYSEIKFSLSDELYKNCPESWFFPPRRIRELIYLLREAMVNTLKHSKGSLTRISGNWEPGKLNLVLSDNGIGFKEKSIRKTMGLKNITERANRIGAALSLNTNPNGLTISLEIPI